jgi:hypothetical protein
MGNGLTVTVETAVPVHPAVVPVTVYEVVVAGEAFAVFTPDDKAPALQTYVAAPLAVKFAVVPSHIVGEFTVIAGNGFTVTVAIAVFVQPEVVPVTV